MFSKFSPFYWTQNEPSSFCYANAEFSSAEGSRALRFYFIGHKMSQAPFATLTLSFSLLDAKRTKSV